MLNNNLLYKIVIRKIAKLSIRTTYPFCGQIHDMISAPENGRVCLENRIAYIPLNF